MRVPLIHLCIALYAGRTTCFGEKKNRNEFKGTRAKENEYARAACLAAASAAERENKKDNGYLYPNNKKNNIKARRRRSCRLQKPTAACNINPESSFLSCGAE